MLIHGSSTYQRDLIKNGFFEHTSHSLLDPFIFVLGFEGDQIHASFSAVVSSVEPVPLGVPDGRVVGSPGEEVVVPSVVLNATIVQSCKFENEIIFGLV